MYNILALSIFALVGTITWTVGFLWNITEYELIGLILTIFGVGALFLFLIIQRILG